MASTEITIDLSRGGFNELGLPWTLRDSKDAKNDVPNLKGDLKRDYDSAKQTIDSSSGVLTQLRNSGSNGTPDGKLKFKYITGIPQTYKFLGMDISSDFQAVIPMGDGYIVVADMFNSKNMIELFNSNSNRYDPADSSIAVDYLKGCSDGLARKIVTSMKAGTLYSMYKKSKEAGKLDLEGMKILTDVVNNSMYDSDPSTGLPLSYQSILLNLVHESNRNKEAMLKANKAQGQGLQSSVAAIVLHIIFYYWEKVVDKYNTMYEALSVLDIWQSTYKKVIGEAGFNRKLIKCCDIVSDDTGEILPGMVSFSGVSRNGDTRDANVFRSSAKSSLKNINDILRGTSYDTDVDSLTDLMLGELDYEKFDNPYELTAEEIQAMSSYDCLQNVDEDASLCMESYNMDDPEERAMFLKSAIRSYERNFKEYKPTDNYDVTEAMAEMIERGDRFKDRIVSEDDYDGEDTSVYVVTNTDKELQFNLDKRLLLKVSKMINKQLTAIDGLF